VKELPHGIAGQDDHGANLVEISEPHLTPTRRLFVEFLVMAISLRALVPIRRQLPLLGADDHRSRGSTHRERASRSVRVG